jgi:hypothetical protein
MATGAGLGITPSLPSPSEGEGIAGRNHSFASPLMGEAASGSERVGVMRQAGG